MSFRRPPFRIRLLILVFFVGVSLAAAQEEPQEPQPAPDVPQEPIPGAPPRPAGYSFPGVIGIGEGELQPDFSPLTGFQTPTLGFPEFRHSYWVPGLQYSSTVQANPGGASGTNWYANNYFIGNLSLLEAWSHSTFAVNYSGGGFVSSGSGQGNGYYQELALAHNYQTERWLFQVVDAFAQSPQSQFGYGGGTNLGIPGVGGPLGNSIPGLGGNYVPNQSIYGVGPFYSNVGALQATYALSKRGSVTVAGSYGLMTFTEPGNIDSNSVVASIGYNYILTRNDTIGLVYRFSSYQFPGSPQAYGDHVMSVAYGRKITGRLGLRIFIGPEITTYRVPIGTASRTTGFSTTTSMTYGFHRGDFSLGYTHGLAGGSGVLTGSILDQVMATYSRSLTRVWSGNVIFGYGRNGPVGGSGATGYPDYGNWFAGGSVNRPIGRYLSFGAAYTATIGDYLGNGCVGACSNPNSTYHTITINVQWHPRPFVLR